MNKFSVKINLLLAIAALLVPALGSAQDTNTNAIPRFPTNAIPHLNPALRPLPMHGAIAAVDTGAMTLTVGNSVLTVTPKTRIFKGTKLATLADLKVGDVVNISYVKAEDGTLKALGIRAIPHPPVLPRQPTDGSSPAPAVPHS